MYLLTSEGNSKLYDYDKRSQNTSDMKITRTMFNYEYLKMLAILKLLYNNWVHDDREKQE